MEGILDPVCQKISAYDLHENALLHTNSGEVLVPSVSL
jgi:hypothetical protein